MADLTRRSFLQVLGVAVGAIAVAPHVSLEAMAPAAPVADPIASGELIQILSVSLRDKKISVARAYASPEYRVKEYTVPWKVLPTRGAVYQMQDDELVLIGSPIQQNCDLRQAVLDLSYVDHLTKPV